MAEKRPLVFDAAGSIQELQDGDSPVSVRIYTLRADGFLRIVTDLDVTLAAAGVILSIKCIRRVAGVSGSTILDINKNGTTIFTTQANRPTFTAAGGNNVIVTPTPDITSLATNDILTFDIDQSETGDVQDVEIEIKAY